MNKSKKNLPASKELISNLGRKTGTIHCSKIKKVTDQYPRCYGNTQRKKNHTRLLWSKLFIRHIWKNPSHQRESTCDCRHVSGNGIWWLGTVGISILVVPGWTLVLNSGWNLQNRNMLLVMLPLSLLHLKFH